MNRNVWNIESVKQRFLTRLLDYECSLYAILLYRMYSRPLHFVILALFGGRMYVNTCIAKYALQYSYYKNIYQMICLSLKLVDLLYLESCVLSDNCNYITFINDLGLTFQKISLETLNPVMRRYQKQTSWINQYEPAYHLNLKTHRRQLDDLHRHTISVTFQRWRHRSFMVPSHAFFSFQ